MPRTASLRLTACLATATVTTALGALAAPAAAATEPARPGPSTAVLDHLRLNTWSAVPHRMLDAPPFGRKIS